ncbi:MAG TPA: peptidoglycan-binding protein [Clostridiaceae bacterium]|nr:peptidoglycan-binding protein [Clostridiaceae bacterium]
MNKRKRAFLTGVVTIVSICFFSTATTFAAPSLLLRGMRGESVKVLQNDLKKLGYFNAAVTGYYGSVTEASVKKLQKDYGYLVDGKAGTNTLALIDKLLNKNNSSSTLASRSTSSRTSSVLKKGMSGSDVTALQNDLKKLGYFNAECTGYYGSLTEEAVKKLQKQNGLTVDGIAGRQTFSIIERLLGNSSVATLSSRGGAEERPASNNQNYMMPWFGEAENVFAIGKTATVYDIESGKSFKIKRTYGHNHADCETLTAKDTQIMKDIYGGQWSWSRRAIIVDVDGVKIAASMAGMPHAGSDKAAANAYIKSRSGGYGAGTNLDAIKGNNMNGVFDIHFYKSKTHGSNSVNQAHQNMVKKAAEWAKNNY